MSLPSRGEPHMAVMTNTLDTGTDVDTVHCVKLRQLWQAPTPARLV